MVLSLFAFFFASHRNQSNRFFAELDFEFVAGIEIEHGGVGLADKQIAVALHLGGVAEFATTFANAG